MKKLVLTGAAGKLGQELRAPLARLCDTLVSTDIADSLHSDLLPNEQFVQADLADLGQIEPILEGADMVIHFGAIGDEAPWDQILQSNLIGAYNVWEAAYRQDVRRVVYASSIHVVGMYEKTQHVGTDVPHRPDTYYGLAKCFAEDCGRLFWEKRGLESVCLRILSCTPTPGNARAIGSWLSFGDLVHLVERAIDTPVVGFTVVYGVSNNDRCPVDNSGAALLGYRPRDNAEDWAKEIFAQASPATPTDRAQLCQGGPFATIELGQSGLAAIKSMDD